MPIAAHAIGSRDGSDSQIIIDGTHAFTGSIGTDFEVQRWITVTHLGYFDSGGDGLRSDITVGLWDVVRGAVVVQRTVAAAATAEPRGSSDAVKYVEIPPTFLPENFVGSIVVSGYGPLEPLPRRDAIGLEPNEGGGLIKLAGNVRFGNGDIASFPTLNHVQSLSGDTMLFAGTFVYSSQRARQATMYVIEWTGQVEYQIPIIYTTDHLQLRLPDPASVIVRVESWSAYTHCRLAGAAPMGESTFAAGKTGARIVTLKGLAAGSHYYADTARCGDGLKLKVTVNDQGADDLAFAQSTAERLNTTEAWRRRAEAEQEQLIAEAKRFDDVVLLPGLVDTYRNLPRKLLGFYQLASAAAPRLGTVKTDDDCFLNVDAILPTMERLPKQGWWSQFREGWPVAHFGKWAEHDYTVWKTFLPIIPHRRAHGDRLAFFSPFPHFPPIDVSGLPSWRHSNLNCILVAPAVGIKLSGVRLRVGQCARCRARGLACH